MCDESRRVVNLLGAAGAVSLLHRVVTGDVSGDAAALAADKTAEEIPAAIREIAERVLKGVKWESASKHEEEGEVVHELFGESADGNAVTVEVTDDAVTGVELEIPLKDVPAAVKTAVAAKFPKFEVEDVLRMYSGDEIRDLAKAEFTYELSGTEEGSDRELHVEVSPQGEIIEVQREIAASDAPKAVRGALRSRAPKFDIETVYRITRKDEVTGYVFVSKRGRTAHISPDGATVDIHAAE